MCSCAARKGGQPLQQEELAEQYDTVDAALI
jgi:hypothetical protein